MKHIILIALLSTLVLGCMKWQPPNDTPSCWAEDMYGWPVPSEWFERKLTIEKADAMVAAELHSLPPNWLEFKSRIKNGDQLWFYSKPMQNWAARTGQNGFVILRDCRIIAWYPFLQN